MTQSDCEPCRISRRAVLKGAGAATTVALAVPTMGTSVAFASTNANRHGDVIVNVFLRGGMDGMSVVVPRTENAGAGFYLEARPTIAVDPAATLRLTDDFGLHPAMAALMPVWNRGDLALVPTAGFPRNNRSHFTVQRQMDYGSGETGAIPTGWLARYLDNLAATDPVGIRGADMPRGERSMQGSTVSITMGSVERFSVAGFTGSGGAAQQALRELHAAGGNIVTDRAAQALDALDLVAGADITPPANGALYPTGGRGRVFGEQMRQIAQLIRADVGVEAAATRGNLSWDTHANQGRYTSGVNRESLEGLAEVLAAFAADLGPLMSKVTVVLMTEFGRTFRENGNGGTDHGRASTMFVMGRGIRGGLYGDWPGVAPADRDGNALRVTTDYRYVLADVLEHRAGATALDVILPGFVPLDDLRLNLAEPVGPVPVIEEPDEPEEVADEPESITVTTPGSTATYVWSAPSGGQVRIDLPAPTDDDMVVEVEAIRSQLAGGETSYAVAVLDNTMGSEPLEAPVFVVADIHEATQTYREAWVMVDLWNTDHDDETLAGQARALTSRLQDASTVPAGGFGVVLVAAPGAYISPHEVRLETPAGQIVLTPAEVDLSEPLEAAM